jgi:Ni,Fe-hydrogenase maturation factor
MLDLANHAELFACPVFIVGVEPEDLSLGEGLSPSVSAALPLAVQAVLDELGRGRDRPRRSAATRRGSQT